MVGPFFGGLLLELSLPTHMNFISFAIPALLGALAILFVQDKYSDFKIPSINLYNILGKPNEVNPN